MNSEPDLLTYVQWLEAENERLRIERNGWRVLAEDSDEVERLREQLKDRPIEGYQKLKEARAEVEHLRALIEAESDEQWREYIAGLEAENERLRAALEEKK